MFGGREHHVHIRPEPVRTGAPANQLFYYDTFTTTGEHATLPVPAPVVARAHERVPNYRAPTFLQELSRELGRQVGVERVGQIYYAEDFEARGKHFIPPEPKPLGIEGGYDFMSGHGGRLVHGADFRATTEHSTLPVARGRVEGFASKKVAPAHHGDEGGYFRGDAEPPPKDGAGSRSGGGGGARRMKKGGMVKGKKGQAVSIVAHAGELVVPAEIVPKVLKSSAWIEHVKSVQKAQGISYKEAMKMAKGTYKK